MKEHFDTVQILGLNDDCHETQYFTRYDAIGPAKNLMKRLATPHLCYVEIREFYICDCEVEDGERIEELFDDLWSYDNPQAFDELWKMAKEI